MEVLLPEDMLSEIFKKLPILDLLPLQTLNKAWNKRISTFPGFFLKALCACKRSKVIEREDAQDAYPFHNRTFTVYDPVDLPRQASHEFVSVYFVMDTLAAIGRTCFSALGPSEIELWDMKSKTLLNVFTAQGSVEQVALHHRPNGLIEMAVELDYGAFEIWSPRLQLVLLKKKETLSQSPLAPQPSLALRLYQAVWRAFGY